MADSQERLVTIDDLAARCALTAQTIRRHVRRGIFPAPLKIGPRALRWREADVAAHIDRLAREAGKGVANVGK